MNATALKNGAIRRVSLVDSVHERVRESIVDGILASSAEISEVALAGQLGVSRTPVHEAVRRLAAEGLVQIDRAGLARVANFSLQDVAEIYELRGCLEPLAAELAALRMPAEPLAELRSEACALAKASFTKSWARKALLFDERLHRELAEASGNARLQAEILKYRHLVRAFCRMSGDETNLRSALDEHSAVLEAIHRRDAAAARQAMHAHIAARRSVVLAEIAAR